MRGGGGGGFTVRPLLVVVSARRFPAGGSYIQSRSVLRLLRESSFHRYRSLDASQSTFFFASATTGGYGYGEKHTRGGSTKPARLKGSRM